MVTKEQIKTVLQRKLVLVGVASVVSASAGATLGYRVAEKRLKVKFEQIAQDEVAEAKKFYSKLHKTEEHSDPVEVAKRVIGRIDSSMQEDYTEAIKGLQYANIPPSEEKADVTVEIETEETVVDEDIPLPDPLPPLKGEDLELTRDVIHNIFGDQVKNDAALEAVLLARDTNRPYILTHDEFYEGEMDYEQTTITYFEGDDVLSDERDQPIDDIERTVGTDNLLKFGLGSKDNNVLYIRNERLGLDFEVLRSTGRYAKEVLGFIEHSENSGKVRKFRRDD